MARVLNYRVEWNWVKRTAHLHLLGAERRELGAVGPLQAHEVWALVTVLRVARGVDYDAQTGSLRTARCAVGPGEVKPRLFGTEPGSLVRNVQVGGRDSGIGSAILGGAVGVFRSRTRRYR